MPEVILPCPECGDDECLIVIQELPSEEWSVHCGCGHAGRYCATEEESIKAHNALPRALQWTNEPPKAIGWYFRRFWRGWIKNRWDTPDIIYVDNEHIKRGVRKIGGTQWAGPIAPPVEG